MKYVTFDLEISKEIPDGCDDWKALRPLGISCAATYTSDGQKVVWRPYTIGGAPYPDKMDSDELEEMVHYLILSYERGYTIVTWNGLGFDFDVLAEECPRMRDEIKALALNHIDIGFHMLCVKGYMVGLQTAADGMCVPGKTEGMHGDLAPVMWKQGREAQDKVLEYVLQDVIATANVYEALVERGRLDWTSRSGRPNSWYFDELLTVNRALEIEEPDTSWMSKPWTREKFYGWTLSEF